MALPETTSSAGWAAAHDSSSQGRRQQLMGVQVEKDLVFATHDGSELALDIYGVTAVSVNYASCSPASLAMTAAWLRATLAEPTA